MLVLNLALRNITQLRVRAAITQAVEKIVIQSAYAEGSFAGNIHPLKSKGFHDTRNHSEHTASATTGSRITKPGSEISSVLIVLASP